MIRIPTEDAAAAGSESSPPEEAKPVEANAIDEEEEPSPRFARGTLATRSETSPGL